MTEYDVMQQVWDECITAVALWQHVERWSAQSKGSFIKAAHSDASSWCLRLIYKYIDCQWKTVKHLWVMHQPTHDALCLHPIFRDPRGYLASVRQQPQFLVCATLWLRDVPSKHQVAPRQFLKCARLHYPGKHTLKHLGNKQPSSTTSVKILLMVDVLEMRSAGRAWHNLVTSNQRRVIRDQGAEGFIWESSSLGFIMPTCKKKRKKKRDKSWCSQQLDALWACRDTADGTRAIGKERAQEFWMFRHLLHPCCLFWNHCDLRQWTETQAWSTAAAEPFHTEMTCQTINTHCVRLTSLCFARDEVDV